MIERGGRSELRGWGAEALKPFLYKKKLYSPEIRALPRVTSLFDGPIFRKYKIALPPPPLSHPLLLLHRC